MLGVDFGTSTSMVAVLDGGVPQILPIGDRTAALASVAGVDNAEGLPGRWVVGEEADGLPIAVRSAKRAITDNLDILAAGDQYLPADDVIIVLLAEVARRTAAAGLGLTARPDLRLSCPAMWTGGQRRRLLALAARAGLTTGLGALIDEPVAAGIAWLSRQPRPVEGRLLVFDMGGGTLDVAVLDVQGDATSPGGAEVSVLAAVGLAHAGDYLDELVAGDLAADLAAAGVEPTALHHPVRAHNRLVHAAREAKEALSTTTEFPVVLPRRIFGDHDLRYTRARLEECLSFPMDAADQCVLAALRTARVTERNAGATYDIMQLPDSELTADISHVVLAGGMSRVPYVARRLRELFGHATVEPATPRPEEAVALGLAEAGRYARINMFRPGFDIMLEWDNGRQRRSLYEAYSPLYESWQVTRGGSELCHRRTGFELHLPQRADGVLRASSPSGEKVVATLGGRSLDGFPVAIDEQRFDFALYCDGSLALSDGRGSYEGEIGWPEIPGGHR